MISAEVRAEKMFRKCKTKICERKLTIKRKSKEKGRFGLRENTGRKFMTGKNGPKK